MCRNIRTLAHLDPSATEDQIIASAEQYVRKISGLKKLPKTRPEIYDRAVADITSITRALISDLEQA
jgi:hypothetical protein